MLGVKADSHWKSKIIRCVTIRWAVLSRWTHVIVTPRSSPVWMALNCFFCADVLLRNYSLSPVWEYFEYQPVSDVCICMMNSVVAQWSRERNQQTWQNSSEVMSWRSLLYNQHWDVIIIIINEKINVAFSRRTARTCNSHKKHKLRKRRV